MKHIANLPPNNLLFIGNLPRDFSGFFMNQFPPDPSVIDTGDKLFTGVNKTGDKLSMVWTGDKFIDGINETGENDKRHRR